MGLGGKFWVMTEVLEPVLVRTAWVCGQKFSHLIIIAFYGNTSYGVPSPGLQNQD